MCSGYCYLPCDLQCSALSTYIATTNYNLRAILVSKIQAAKVNEFVFCLIIVWLSESIPSCRALTCIILLDGHNGLRVIHDKALRVDFPTLLEKSIPSSPFPTFLNTHKNPIARASMM